MNNLFSLHSFIVVVLSLAAGLLYAWLLYGRPENLSLRYRLLLAAFRTTAIAIIGSLLFLPPYRTLRYDLEKPLIVLVQDNSGSVTQYPSAGFDSTKYAKDFRALATRLAEKYMVEVVHFNDKTGAGFDFKSAGAATDAATMAAGLSDRLMNRNVGAIVLATDGIFNRGGNPQYQLSQLRAPVYTIALGNPVIRRDIAISDVLANDITYLDNVFTVEVSLDAYKTAGETFRLAVSERNQELDSKTIQIKKDEEHQRIVLKIRAVKPGIHKYTVSLPHLANEVTTKNNSHSFFVEVIDSRQKILLASAMPHPDLTAIRQSLEANKHYEVKLALADDLEGLNPADYSLILLYQLPAQPSAGKGFLEKVKKSTVPVWHFAGAQTDLAALNSLQTIVRFSSGGASLQETYPYLAPAGTSFQLDPVKAAKLKNFDALQFPSVNLQVAGQAVPVLYRRNGREETGVPMLFFAMEQNRKKGFFIGEGLWRWRLTEAREDESAPLFNELIQKSAQYLSIKDDKRKLRVTVSKPGFDESEHVTFSANLYDDSYKPIADADISLQVKNDKGRRYNFAFAPSAGQYQLDAGTFPLGDYTFQASAVYKSKKYAFIGRFFVSSTQLEYRQAIADHQLLNSISSQSGGKLFQPADLAQIFDEIEKNPEIKTISYENLRYEEPVGIKTIFFIILLLLSAEWLLRKRNGAV
ncbi:hypothetical protein [Pedobacter sp. SYP-B3415]|uniref:hypothetical protein n=1 Tax=Pedobacter sp. SYP-B3415 TaxID=2496641 RepID=UPI00101D0F3C|nr:hypothetical protein [Pedobacter sp. SYP-B3415]